MDAIAVGAGVDDEARDSGHPLGRRKVVPQSPEPQFGIAFSRRMPRATGSTEQRLGNYYCSCPYDRSYVAKELSRTLQSPTQDDDAKLKHTIRYLKGTKHYWMPTTSNGDAATGDMLNVTMFVDSDGVGCTTTVMSTMGYPTTVRGTAIDHDSRTQTAVALAPGEAELCGLSSGTLGTMGVLRPLREVQCQDQQLRHHGHGRDCREVDGLPTKSESSREVQAIAHVCCIVRAWLAQL